VTPLRPALVCGALLAALDASEGRRRRRKRDTTPDAIGMSLKHQLLPPALEADPDPDAVEGWLLARCLTRADDGSVIAQSRSLWVFVNPATSRIARLPVTMLDDFVTHIAAE